jgi:subtilisin-like proprotein convertase family protein
MSGDSLAPGVYSVTYETTDSDGNTSSCTFNVTVADTEAPVAVCQDISLDLDASGMVTVTAADLDNGSSDNCGIVSSELTVIDTATVSLDTGFNATAAISGGHMFDVMAINDLTINSFGINVNDAPGAVHDYEVYYKVGSFVGSEQTAADWSLVASPTGIVNAGFNSPTPLNTSLGIDVAAGETVAFYITSSDGSAVAFTAGTAVGDLAASDANLEFYEGVVNLYPFGGFFATWKANVTVVYDVTGPTPFSGTFDCSNTGANVVTVTHTDASGNSTSCTSTVTISDVTAPEIVCIGEPGNTTDTTSQSPALDIVDNTTVSTAMTVADDFVITDLDVDIDIAHTWTGDMQITLESPAGTQVLIFDGSADGCSGDDLMVRFDDESVNALDCQAGTADAFPEADYIPSNALAAFAGESTLGDWTLSIEDTAGGDPGILNTWALNYAHDVTGTPLEVVLDANGMFTLNAADLLFSVNEACSPMPIFAGSPPVASSLPTTFDGGNGQAGNMFDIVAINDLTIDSFDVSIDSGVTDDVEVYFKTGTWVGFDADPAAWTLLTTVTGVTSAGDNVPTPLNQTLGVNVLAGEMVAFYVTLTTTTAINYTNGTATGALFASDDNLEFYEGSGKVYPFDTTFEPRIFNGNIVYSAGGVADSMTIDLDCSMLGENLIEVTVVDASGNSSSCMATVLVKDETAPDLVCVDATIELDADGFATIDPMLLVDPSSSDACGIENFGVSITEVSCSDIGTPLEVTLFVTDASGNPSSCVAMVTVIDTLAPVITCPADQTVDPGTGNLFYEVPDYIATAEATALDNCTDPVSITTQDPAPGTLISDGVYTVTITGEDESGNVGSCSFELTVESVLGVESNELNSAISMYPNPAQEQVSIANSSNIQLETAEIYDLNGKLLKQVDLSTMQGEQMINISEFAPGVYVVKLASDTASAVKRLIKK